MKMFKCVRIIIYILILVSLLWLKFTDNTFGECYIAKNLGIQCPSCGITRATKDILDLDFASATRHNAYYVLVLLPTFLVFLFDDIICIFLDKTSFVEMILGK